MTNIYMDLETYRPEEDGAFIGERIIADGLIIDKTHFHSERRKPTLTKGEWAHALS
jgi:hypothetical protein